MCLAIPMQVTAVDGLNARCEAKGVVRDVGLLLLAELGIAPGDFVVVHAGLAVERISPERARDAWALYDLMLAGAGSGSGPMA